MVVPRQIGLAHDNLTIAVPITDARRSLAHHSLLATIITQKRPLPSNPARTLDPTAPQADLREMTEKNAPRPIVDQSSSTSPTPDCDEIAHGMDARSGACEDAALDDERQWLATVLEDLERRSPRVREALKKVLSDGDRDVDPLPVLKERQIFPLTKCVDEADRDGTSKIEPTPTQEQSSGLIP